LDSSPIYARALEKAIFWVGLIDAFRLTGIGWIFAFFIVGATVLTGSWLLTWQVK
jgi:hypothetical protein